MLRKKLFGLAFISLAFSGFACSEGSFPFWEIGLPAGNEQYYEFNWTDMADQPKLKPQRADIFGTNVVSMIAPPEGSIATTEFVYPYAQKDADLAGKEVVNPLQTSDDVVQRGKWVFENTCIVCHGKEAAGDGEVARLFPKPPSLMRRKVREYTDGRIFHVPMRGQNSMPVYATQLEPEELWSVVHYIRDMQKRLPVAPDTDDDKKYYEELRKAEEKRRAEEEAALGEDAPQGEAAPDTETAPAE